MNGDTIHELIDVDLTISAIHLALEKQCPPNWRFEQKEGREFQGLVYIIEGSAVYYKDGKELLVRQNDILYLKSNSTYVTVGSEYPPYHYIVTSFTSNDTQLPLKEVQTVADPTYYIRAFRELANTWFYKRIAHKIKCKAILQDILFNIIRSSLQNRMDAEDVFRIQPAISYITNYFYKDMCVEDLADMSNLSVSHFRRVFTRVYGVSPVQYINLTRISKAKDLLLSDLYSISQIAEMVGYNNIYYFSRVFKKLTGETPTQFRKGF